MIGRTNAGGGAGGGLNFKVVGGTSTPASTKENTIWVNTSTAITSWVFSATEPEAPAAGMVWISTGTVSSVEFNALKKNSIMVYPLSAKQYVGGAWVEREAKSYQNGAWVDWRTYLFKSGVGSLVELRGRALGNGTVSIDTDSIKVSYRSLEQGTILIDTPESLDLSFAKRLCFEVKLSYAYNPSDWITTRFGILTSSPSAVPNQKPDFSAAIAPNPDGVRRVVTVDVSAISSGYLAVFGVMTAEIFNIWIE